MVIGNGMQNFNNNSFSEMILLKIVSNSLQWITSTLAGSETHTFIHSSSQWHDGADDKEDISSSILHPQVRFLNQQRDKYFCAGLIQKLDSVLCKFTKFEAPKLGKTFQRRNSVPSLSQVSTLAKISCPVVCPPFWYNTQNVYFLWFNNWW